MKQQLFFIAYFLFAGNSFAQTGVQKIEFNPVLQQRHPAIKTVSVFLSRGRSTTTCPADWIVRILLNEIVAIG